MAESVGPQPVAAGGNRRALVFLAIGVALVLLVFAAKILTGGSGSGSATSSPKPATSAAANPLAVTATPGQPAAVVPAAGAATTTTLPGGPPPNTTRNPFQPLR